MNDQIKNELITLGLSALEQAICHFGDIKDCNESNAIYKLLSLTKTFAENLVSNDK
jgi:hypothetical protein